MKTVNIKYQTLKGQTPCRCFKRRLEKHQHLLLNPNNEFLLMPDQTQYFSDNHYDVNNFFLYIQCVQVCICFWLMEIIQQEYISVLCFIILCLTYLYFYFWNKIASSYPSNLSLNPLHLYMVSGDLRIKSEHFDCIDRLLYSVVSCCWKLSLRTSEKGSLGKKNECDLCNNHKKLPCSIVYHSILFLLYPPKPRMPIVLTYCCLNPARVQFYSLLNQSIPIPIREPSGVTSIERNLKKDNKCQNT